MILYAARYHTKWYLRGMRRKFCPATNTEPAITKTFARKWDDNKTGNGWLLLSCRFHLHYRTFWTHWFYPLSIDRRKQRTRKTAQESRNTTTTIPHCCQPFVGVGPSQQHNHWVVESTQNVIHPHFSKIWNTTVVWQMQCQQNHLVVKPVPMSCKKLMQLTKNALVGGFEQSQDVMSQRTVFVTMMF